MASLCALATKDQYRKQFTDEQISKLGEMAGAVRTYGKPMFDRSMAIDAETLVHTDENWISLRNVARQCLVSFGVYVESLSPADTEKEYKIQ